MNIMTCRRTYLEETLETLNATNIPLVSVSNNTFIPSGLNDDLGIYYFIPWVAKSFGIPIDQAINIFLCSLLFMGAIISIFCFFFIFKHLASRLISFIGIGMLTYAAYKYSDVYIASFFAVACIAPIFILWNQKPSKLNWKLILSFAFSGVIIGYSNIIRSHAGTGILLFLLSWIFLNKELLKREKVFSLLALSAFTCIPYLHFNALEKNRDAFIIKNNPSYLTTSIVHPKWHSIYIGFGYLENKYGITYTDMVSFEKAKSVKPNVVYCSNEYEQILRDQCFLLAKNDPAFVFKTIFAKAIKLFFRFLQFANFGLLFALFYVRPPIRSVMPFMIAALFYSIPGILTIPVADYVSGLTSIAMFFGIYMICLGIEKYKKEDIAQRRLV